MHAHISREGGGGIIFGNAWSLPLYFRIFKPFLFRSVGAYDGAASSSADAPALALTGRDTHGAVFSVLAFLRKYDAFTAAVIERSDLQVGWKDPLEKILCVKKLFGFIFCARKAFPFFFFFFFFRRGATSLSYCGMRTYLHGSNDSDFLSRTPSHPRCLFLSLFAAAP